MLAGALLLAGCGSTPLSVTQLRSSATRICQAAEREKSRIPTPETPAAAVSFLRSGAGALRYELSGLRSLRPPNPIAGQYSSTIQGFAQQLGLVQDSVQQITHGEDPVIAVKLLQTRLGPLEAEQQTDWSQLGIPACMAQ